MSTKRECALTGNVFFLPFVEERVIENAKTISMLLSESDTRAKLIDPAIHARGWTVTRQEIEAKNFDLKAINPHAKSEENIRTPEELLDLIEAKGQEVSEVLKFL